jgi:6-phospho-beta-glucosidase
MSGPKIAIIGGGSAYCPVFINALVEARDAFQGSHLALMDIDAEHLSIVHRLAQRMMAAAGAKITVTQTTDRDSAIAGADFVVTTFRPGGFEARVQDEKIPLAHGVIGQETVGPGGFFMALRSVSIIQAIVETMETSAPGATLLNYTNPTNIVTEAVARHSAVPIIGMCDQNQGDKRAVAQALDVDPSVVDYHACGLNHATWSTRFSIDGQDGIPYLLARAPGVIADPQVPEPVKRMFKLAQWYERIPNRYMQYYYWRAETVREARASALCRAEQIMAELPGYFQHYREESEKEQPDLVRMRGGSKAFGDFAVNVIRSIIEDADKVLTLNVLNRGALPDFDPDIVVEVPCLVNRYGAQPLAQDRLPAAAIGLLHALANYQSLAAAAAWNGCRKEATLALLANPLVGSLSLAEELYAELARAHAPHLPERLL